jgi:hypothetical protein
MTISNDHTQDQLGLAIACRLNEAAHELPHDISERLRAARIRALSSRLSTQPRLQVSLQGAVGMLQFGDEGLNLWSRMASFLPLVALVAGLALIQNILDDNRASELAEVDSAMLSDDLPPSAYADPGFLQFLKTPVVIEIQKAPRD